MTPMVVPSAQRLLEQLLPGSVGQPFAGDQADDVGVLKSKARLVPFGIVEDLRLVQQGEEAVPLAAGTDDGADPPIGGRQDPVGAVGVARALRAGRRGLIRR